MWNLLMLNIIGVLADILGIIGFDLHSLKIPKFCTVIWKKPIKIKPKHLEINKFHEYYYETEEMKNLVESLENKENTIIIGKPLSGKTRNIYEAIRRVEKKYAVTIVKNIDIYESNVRFPRLLKFWRTKLIIIDDLHKFVAKINFHLVIREIQKQDCILLFACRSRIEYSRANNKFKKEFNFGLEELFENNKIEIQRISKAEGLGIAKHFGVKWIQANQNFDGTVGSLLLSFVEMDRRYKEEIDVKEQIILQSIKRLYCCGLYIGKQNFDLSEIKKVCEYRKLKGEEWEWEIWLLNLYKNEFFVDWNIKQIFIEEAYIEKIVEIVPEKDVSDIFREIILVFNENPDTLLKIGFNAQYQAIKSKNTEELLLVSIQAFERIIHIEPKNHQAYYHLSTSYFDLERWEKSINYASQCIKLNKRHQGVYVRIALSYLANNQEEEAKKALLKAIKHGIEFPLINVSLGIIYKKQDRIEEAINIFKKAISYSEKIDARSYLEKFIKKASGYDLAYRELGLIYLAQEQWTIAEKMLENALLINPEDFESHYSLGNVYMKLSKKDEAIREYELASKIKPEKTENVIQIIFAFIQNYNFEKAKEVCDTGLQRDPTNALLLYLKGLLFLQTKQWEKAIYNFIEVWKNKEKLPYNLELNVPTAILEGAVKSKKAPSKKFIKEWLSKSESFSYESDERKKGIIHEAKQFLES